jgi:hypothetical protein
MKTYSEVEEEPHALLTSAEFFGQLQILAVLILRKALLLPTR